MVYPWFTSELWRFQEYSKNIQKMTLLFSNQDQNLDLKKKQVSLFSEINCLIVFLKTEKLECQLFKLAISRLK